MHNDRTKKVKQGKWISAFYSDPNRDEDAITGKFFDFKLFGRLMKYISPHKKFLILSFVCLIVFTLSNLVYPKILQYFIDDVAGNDKLPLDEKTVLLIYCIGAIFILFVFRALSSFGQSVFSALLGHKSMHALRTQIFQHVIRHSVRFYGAQPVGRLLTRTVNDVLSLNELLANALVSLLGHFITISVSLLMMFLYSWRLALIALAITPFLLIATSIFRKKIRNSFRKIRWLIARLNAFLAENLSGIRIIQMFRREEKSYNTFMELNVDAMIANLSQVFYSAVFTPTIEILSITAKATVLYFAGTYIFDGGLETGAFVAFILYFDKGIDPIRNLAEQYNVFQGAMASTERIFSLLDTEHDIIDSEDVIEPVDKSGSVELENVWFAYDNENWVLKDINLSIKSGESIALVGATGAGKSSIINLLCRFYDINKGSIKINGVDVSKLSHEYLNRSIVLVPQDVFLFSDSIANNIRLWDKSITDEDILTASKYVNSHPFISKLPEGYDTTLKERAAGLSVGQKQLISFARALAHSPEILVLDEATSSIDPETEELIQDALLKLMKGRTSIVVAHRLSTVRKCDKIVVLHKGRIREMGTHDELIEKDGIYRKLYELQYKSQNEKAS